jgi:putative ATP-dependent endonuclease of OLD family
MYLKNLLIKNFRAIKEASFTFDRGLNTIIGENNSGKTAVIDALRICFSYGNQWRDIYIRKDDFYIDVENVESKNTSIEFDLIFEIEKEEESGLFYDLLVQKDDKQELQMHFYYYIQEIKGTEKVKYKIWGGENEGQQITPDVLDLINFVYLSPARDAVDALRPVRWNRLGELFSNIVIDKEKRKIDEKYRKELAAKVTSFYKKDDDWTNLIESGKEKINKHLNKTSIEGKEQNIDINFLPFEFRRIVDNLRIQFPFYKEDEINGDLEKQKYLQISQNGLGYNNLLYIATVLGDLTNKKEYVEPKAYYSLLIEEPEAHLHPQLQNIFFNYMNVLDKKGIQIFITSHSPTITAKVDLNSLIILQNQQRKIYSLSLRKSELNEINKKYLAKFLDVTKSQLFFSNGTILVEGISEALLMPVFSRIMGKEYDIEKKGIEIVNINGVAFEHFAKLYNSNNKGKRLASRCAIITDNDRDKETKEFSSRAKKALKLKGGNLKVYLGEITFEHELFTAGDDNGDGNEDIILKIYNEMHPRTRFKKSSKKEGADFLINKLNDFEDKSELAHRLAIKLDEDNDARSKLKVPKYIQDAIKWVVKSE